MAIEKRRVLVDNIYNKNTLSNPANNGAALGNNSQNNSSLSPWDEDLDLPEETPRGTIVGSLNPAINPAPLNNNTPDGPDKFAIPSDQIATNAVPTLVQASDYLPNQVPSQIPEQPADKQNQVEVQSQGVNNASVVPVLPVAAETVQPVEVSPQPQVVAPPPSIQAEAGADSLIGNSQLVDGSANQPIAQPVVNGVLENAATSQVTPPSSPQTAPENAFSKFNFLNKNKPNQVKEERKEEIQVGLETKKMSTLKKGLLFSVLGIFLLLIGLSVLTEMGFVSIGLEKVYGAVGLEKLWGGLGNDTQTALGRSLLAASKSNSIDVRGSVVLTVDKDVKSKIVTPLVSKNETNRSYTKLYEKAFLASDSDVNSTSSQDSATDPSYTDSSNSALDSSGSSTDQSSSSTSASADSSSDQASSTSNDTQSTTNTDSESNTLDQSQSDSGSYQSISSSATSVDASFSGTFRNAGSDLDFQISRIVGQSDLSVKESGSKIWVKSSDIKYSDKETSSNWVSFNLNDLSDNNLIGDFFSAQNSQGMSVKGKRLGSEVVSGVKSYKYSIESLEIGDSLKKFGIDSSMIQGIIGDAWIGIKDKKLQKINLKITTSSGGAVSEIDLKIEFTGYNQAAEFSEPDSSSVISSSDTVTGTTNTTDVNNTTPATSDAQTDAPASTTGGTTADNSTQSTSDNTALDSTSTDQTLEAPVTTVSNDESRRNNLKAIKDALEKYKVAKGKYPIAKDLVHLNAPLNIVETSLVPSFLSILPKDPADSNGWFYGYKSADGKSYYLTSRMDASSADTKTVDGLYLYFLYNN